MSINFPPGYPLTFEESHGTLIMDSESGYEERYPKCYWPNRRWDLTYYSSEREADVDDLRNFLHRQEMNKRPFLFKEPYLTTRNSVKLGHGTGTRTKWLVPLLNYQSITFYANSLSVGASVAEGTGTASLGIVTFDSAPAMHDPVEISWVMGYYVPMVYVLDVFKFTLAAYDGIGQIRFSLVETKQDYPEA